MLTKVPLDLIELEFAVVVSTLRQADHWHEVVAGVGGHGDAERRYARCGRFENRSWRIGGLLLDREAVEDP
jgi:hypothetical protein